MNKLGEIVKKKKGGGRPSLWRHSSAADFNLVFQRVTAVVMTEITNPTPVFLKGLSVGLHIRITWEACSIKRFWAPFQHLWDLNLNIHFLTSFPGNSSKALNLRPRGLPLLVFTSDFFLKIESPGKFVKNKTR